MNQMILHGSATALLALTTFCSADDLAIERIAPENSFLVVGVKDVAALKTDYQNSGFARLWEDGPIRDFIEQMSGQSLDDMDGQFEQMIAEMGFDPEDFVMPTGGAGMAMYMAENDEGIPMPATLSFANYGDNAEKFSGLIEKMLEEGVKNDAITYELNEIGTRVVYSIDIPQEVAELQGEMPQGMQVGGLPLPVPDIGAMIGSYDQMHIVRHRTSFFASTQMDRLAETLNLLDNDHATEFMLRDAYRGASRQIGTQQDVYGIFFVEPLMQAIAMQQPMVMMVQPMIAMVVGDVQAMSVGMNLNAAGSDMDMTVGIFMPNGMMGLTSLMDENMPMTAPPSFVSPNAVSYSTTAMDFAGLLDVVAPLLGANPMMDGEEMMNQINMMFGPMLDALGNKMYTVGMKSDSGAGQMFAMECRDQQKFEEAFSGIAPMLGFQARDFLGNRIYGMDMGMLDVPAMPGTPDSLGIGGGHVFIGTSNAVEQALRAVADDQALSITEEPLYQNAVGAIPSGEYVSWGFTNIVEIVRSVMEQQQLAMQQMVEDMRQWDPELADELAAEAMASAEMFQMFDFEALDEYVGPMVGTVKAHDDGFVVKSRLLKAGSE